MSNPVLNALPHGHLKGEPPVRRCITPQQMKIASLLAQGMSNKEAAQAMGLAAGTVKVYVCALMKRLELGSRLQVALWYREEHRG